MIVSCRSIDRVKPAALLAATALSAATLAGCSWTGPEQRGTQVVAATYPLAFVAERIAGATRR